MNHKKLIGLLLFASMIGIFTIALTQQPNIPFLPTQIGATQIQTAKTPTINNLTTESLYVLPSALENSTYAIALDNFNQSFFNLTPPSGVTNILGLSCALIAHVAGQALNYSAPDDTGIFFSLSSGNMPLPISISQFWNETIVGIFVLDIGSDTSAAQNCNSTMEQIFTQINQTLSTNYGISVQKCYNETMVVPASVTPLHGPSGLMVTEGLLFSNTLNTSAEVYNVLKGMIPDNTFSKTIANESSPSHMIAISDGMLNMTGTLQPAASSSQVGATIEGQIGQSGGSYTFSTRNLLNISPGSNITSQAPTNGISIILPTTSNITDYYAPNLGPSNTVTYPIWMTPTVWAWWSTSSTGVEDVNVTYTLQSTVPYVVSNYDMTNWNMNPGDTANLTLTLTNVGTATAYNVYPYLYILDSTVMYFTNSSYTGPLTIDPGDSVVINYGVAANNTGSTSIYGSTDFSSYPDGLSVYNVWTPTQIFPVHVGISEPLLEYSANCSNWVVSPGDNVSVYWTLRNVGTQTAINVTVPLTPILGSVIDSNVTLPGIGQYWTLGDIPAGEAITANVTSEVDYPSFHTGGTPTIPGLMPLTLPGLRPSTAAYLEFQKYPEQVTVSVNDIVPVKVIVTNFGTQTEYVNISDVVPSDYFVVSGGSTSISGIVNGGDSLTLTYNLTAVKAGTVRLSAPFIGRNYTGIVYCNKIIETTPPTVSITSPSNSTMFNASSVTVNWTGNDTISGIGHYEVRIDGGSWSSVGMSTSHTFNGLSNSSHTVDVRAFDLAGNNANTSVSFTVSLPPAAPAVDFTAVLVSLSLMQQQGLPLSYIAIGGVGVIAVVVGLAILLNRRAKH